MYCDIVYRNAKHAFHWRITQQEKFIFFYFCSKTASLVSGTILDAVFSDAMLPFTDLATNKRGRRLV